MDALGYETRAAANAPKTAAEQEQEARRLACDGFGDYTIAQALRLSVEQVRRFLGEAA